jgi:hypothetical protein
MSDEKTPLFQSVLCAMKIAEKTKCAGPTKRELVTTLLKNAGLITAEDEPHVAVIIDMLIWSAKNAGDLKTFAKKTGCLPCR